MGWEALMSVIGHVMDGVRRALLGALVIVAAFVLLFTAKYPRGLFDFLLGIHRWLFRVVAYVALMTDRYPPFRLDQGPDEPTPAESVTTAPVPERTG